MKNFVPLTVVVLFIFLIVVVLAQLSGSSKEDGRVYSVGIIARGSAYEQAIEGYKKRMTELGYEEGLNIIYDVRIVLDKDQLSGVVREFIAKDVDLIHTYSTPATQAAYKETKDIPRPIPVVFGSMGDPIISGVIKDIQRPGTNVTGVASLSTELTSKRLEILKQIDPGIERVAMPYTSKELKDVAADKSVEIAKKTADYLKINLILFPVTSEEDNKVVAEKITGDLVEGVVFGGDSLVWGGAGAYIQQAIKERIPLVSSSVEQAKSGALIGIGVDYSVSGIQSADITNKILRGGDPSKIPVQLPEKILLVVNMKTAQQIGIKFNMEFLSQVDLIISDD